MCNILNVLGMCNSDGQGMATSKRVSFPIHFQIEKVCTILFLGPQPKMGPIAQKSRWRPLREAADCKLKQKDLREKLSRSKSMNCRADKTKLLERWKEKKGGDTGSFGNMEKEQEMLIAKMRSEDKEEASKLLLRLKEEVQSQKPLNVSIKGGREESILNFNLKEEDGDGRVHEEKPENSLDKNQFNQSNCG